MEVDVSNVLQVGDPYWLYDVEDIRTPVLQGVYNGDLLEIPTDQTSCFLLYGTNVYGKAVHSQEDFGAFLLIGREIDISADNQVGSKNLLPAIMQLLP